jgi:hypothetical protein
VTRESTATLDDLACNTVNPKKRWFLAGSLPILMSTWVVLHFFFTNYVELEMFDVLSTLAWAFGFTLLLWGLFYAFLKDVCKASLVSTMALFCFYGHPKFVFQLFRLFYDTDTVTIPLKGTYEIPMQLQVGGLVALALMVLIVTFVLKRMRSDFFALTYFCWHCSVAAVCISTASGLYTIYSVPYPVLQPPQARKTDQKPDIYIIVLDAFGRPDILEKHYGFSVQPFVQDLQQQGFHVFSKSHSNFSTTAYSLSSELNFTYLDQESVGLGADYPSPIAYPLISLRENNRLARFLKLQGYQVVNIFGGGDFTRRFSVTDLSLGSSEGVNGSTYLFLRHTPVNVIAPNWLQIPELDRRRTAVLDALKDMRQLHTQLKHPSFVMVHLLCPHDPFFLDENGGRPYQDPHFDWQGNREFAKGYAGQAKFLAKQVSEITAEIIKNSPTPPVIIIQGDHGPAPLADSFPEQCAQRYPNLCAMHLPDKNYQQLPEDITPVNYFRYLLNRYFDTNLEILPNHSYHPRKPFVYQEVSSYIDAVPTRDSAQKSSRAQH